MKIIYVWEPNQALVWEINLYLNEEWIIEVKVGSKEDEICKTYKLQNLKELYEKYFSKKEKKSKK